ncbi:nuclear transport factor 2 family protein [Paludibaculum fermentans]|uniref:nuclear transport factor 2 family protein n=1 Tax=Paludibaculum fermentans TaxID=1473598 RepID=UPI003EBE10F5
MNHLTELIDRYFAIWNETDADARRTLIASTWTEDATYVDPLIRAQGHDGINAMVEGIQRQFDGCQFHRAGQVDEHNDRARFTWELRPAGDTAIAGGVDFAAISDGRLHTVTGFLDFAPLAAKPQ